MAEQLQEASDKNVEIWKIKKLIKSLEAARGYYHKFLFLFLQFICFAKEWYKHDFIDYSTS